MKKLSSAEYTLLANNIIPLVGVIFFKWSIPEILMVYWCETVIMGVFTLIKIWWLEIPPGIASLIGTSLHKFGMSVIFTIFFGCFSIFNLAITAALSVYYFPEGIRAIDGFESLINWPVWENIKWTVLILLVLQAVSFYQKYIKTFEYKRANISNLVFEPYKRIFFLNSCIFITAFIIKDISYRNAMHAILIIFVIGKTLIELYSKDKFGRRIYA